MGNKERGGEEKWAREGEITCPCGLPDLSSDRNTRHHASLHLRLAAAKSSELTSTSRVVRGKIFFFRQSKG